MELKKLSDSGIYSLGQRIQEIGSSAVAEALKENKEMGIPTVFSDNGVIYYELPDGEITTVSPFEEV